MDVGSWGLERTDWEISFELLIIKDIAISLSALFFWGVRLVVIRCAF